MSNSASVSPATSDSWVSKMPLDPSPEEKSKVEAKAPLPPVGPIEIWSFRECVAAALAAARANMSTPSRVPCTILHAQRLNPTHLPRRRQEPTCIVVRAINTSNLRMSSDGGRLFTRQWGYVYRKDIGTGTSCTGSLM